MQFGPEPPPEQEDDETDLLPCRQRVTLTGHDGAVLAIRFNKEGTYCLSCGKDRTVRLWNPERGILVKTYEGHGYEVRDVCVAKDNSKFATGGGDRQIFLWDVGSGKTIRRFKGHEKTINTLTFGAEDGVMFSGGYDTFVHVWDCRSRNYNAIQTLSGFKDSVTCVKATGTEIFASCVDGTLKRFDIRMGQVCTDDFREPVTCVALSGDEACVLVACMSDRMVLTDKSSGQVLATYRGHKHRAYKIECGFTPTDAHVVGASEDGFVYYWDLVRSNIAKQFRAHKDTVCSIATHAECHVLLTASTDGEIKVWGPDG
ncbi:hypothetical protein BSKO_10519 [Bryopsis sp. KO-2023]|nr:hypothetical protein BSKO_10519 [Bryopsis sp. KO-2023]